MNARYFPSRIVLGTLLAAILLAAIVVAGFGVWVLPAGLPGVLAAPDIPDVLTLGQIAAIKGPDSLLLEPKSSFINYLHFIQR